MTAKLDGTNGLIQQYDYQVSTTGFSYTFAAGTTVLVMNPAGTLATGTITMPASPADGMTITFSSTQTISALTINGNTGQTVVSKPSALNANQALSYVYRLSNTTWYPLGTQVTQATGPAFSTYPSTTLNPSTSTWTKMTFNTENFDTNSNFDTTTYRFTPTVAGYYQINAVINTAQTAASNTRNAMAIYKNGSSYKIDYALAVGGDYALLTICDVISMNGSTDYLEIYVWCTLSSNFYGAGGVFSGFLARSA
jgi:hypothetical protein